MKKIILGTACTVFFLLGIGASNAGTLGDVDHDGDIDLTEAVHALRVSSGVQSTVSASYVMVWRGAWALGEEYNVYDAVQYEGSSYICIQHHTSDESNSPPDEVMWNVLALEGEQGPEGPPASDADTLDGLDSTAFVTTETDPTVDETLKDGITWSEIDNRPTGLDDGDDVGVTTETDPTVEPTVKDGVSWDEVTGKPGGFDDGIDNDSGGDITAVTAGTGLSGGGTSGDVSLQLDIPLSLTASTASVVIGATNTGSGPAVMGIANDATAVAVHGHSDGSHGNGVVGSAEGQHGVGVLGAAHGTEGYGVYGACDGGECVGVRGLAYETGEGVENYGGYFKAMGDNGRGVYAEASSTAAQPNYGGMFKAAGVYGRGVYGDATGHDGHGVHGTASGPNGMGIYGESTHADGGRGVYGESAGGTGVRGLSYASDGKGVSGLASKTGEDVENYGGSFTASGGKGRGVYGEAPRNGGRFKATGNQGRAVYAEATNTNSIGLWGKATAENSSGVWGEGKNYDFYAIGEGTNYGAFTGAHEVKLVADAPNEVMPGMIVSATGEVQIRKNQDGVVSLSSTLPTVRLSEVTKDKAVFGVITKEAPLHEEHWYEPAEGERFGIVNALGEGRVWVSEINGAIEAGDYITTSSIAGYGQKQDDDFLHSYTLGKAIETIDWDSVVETVEYAGRMYKVYLLAVVYTSG